MTHFRKWKKYGLPCRWRIPLRWQTNKNLDMVLGRQTGRIFTLWKSLRSQSITIRGILLHKQDEHQLKGNFLKQSHVEQIENPQSFKKDLFFFFITGPLKNCFTLYFPCRCCKFQKQAGTFGLKWKINPLKHVKFSSKCLEYSKWGLERVYLCLGGFPVYGIQMP